MDRVGRYVRIAVSEVDIDHDEIVNVIELITNLICSDFACHTSYDEVPRSAACDFIGHM